MGGDALLLPTTAVLAGWWTLHVWTCASLWVVSSHMVTHRVDCAKAAGLLQAASVTTR
jgi:hypothetical protein